MRTEHMLYDFTAYMEAAKDRAAARRHRGLSTGKAAAGHNRKASDLAPRPERGSFAELVGRTNAYWNHACSEAIDGFRFACYGDPCEGVDLMTGEYL